MDMFYGISARNPLNPKLNCSLHNCGCRASNFIWVSDRLKLIYFETPKCSCSSIKIALNVATTPLHFATASLMHSQNHCSALAGAGELLSSVNPWAFGIRTTPDALASASLSAAANLSEGRLCSDPIGSFEFMHFFGSAEQAVDLFPDYKKFIVWRDPFDRLLSTWNMFYNSQSFRLAERVFQCKNSVQERRSFRYFVENIWVCPNHHFDRIVNFVSFDVLASGVDIVSFKNLATYWERIKAEYELPSLGFHNVARSYLNPDVEKEEVERSEKFLSYYTEDRELAKLAL